MPLLGFYLLAASSALTTGWLLYLIRVEVDSKVSDADRIGPLGFNFGVYLRVLQLHKALYPKSRLRLCMHIFEILGVISALIAFKIRGLI